MERDLVALGEVVVKVDWKRLCILHLLLELVRQALVVDVLVRVGRAVSPGRPRVLAAPRRRTIAGLGRRAFRAGVALRVVDYGASDVPGRLRHDRLRGLWILGVRLHRLPDRLGERIVDGDLAVRRHLDAELLQGAHELLLLRLAQIAEL